MDNDITIKLATKRITESVAPEILSFFTRANKLGVDGVDFEFSGSGDSGDLQDTTLWTLDEKGEEESFSEGTEEHNTFENDLCTLFNDHLIDRIDWDWYNNEGGGGTIKVNFKTGAVEISGYYYSQSDADGVEFNILGEEEGDE